MRTAVVSFTLALAATAGMATAGNITAGSSSYPTRTVLPGPNVGPAYGERGNVQVNLSGQSSWDLLGSPNNAVLLVDVAAGLGLPSGSSVIVTGLDWDVEIQTTLAGPFGGSWLSEARITFGSIATPNIVGLRPGAGVNTGGTQRFAGGVNFVDVALPDIILADGIMRLELNETFDDAAGEIDANYLAQSFVSLRAIPSPGAIALMGMGGLIIARRRR